MDGLNLPGRPGIAWDWRRGDSLPQVLAAAVQAQDGASDTAQLQFVQPGLIILSDRGGPASGAAAVGADVE